MTRTLKLLTLILLITYDCIGQQDTTFKKADHFITNKFDVAIFPANYLDFIPRPRFTPTRQDVEKAELALKRNLKNLNKKLINQSSTPIIHEKLNNYKRQYFGYIDKNGNRVLFINCFWSNDKDDSDSWLTERTMVLDGGSYYWNVKYNLDKNELFDLAINGYA